MRQSQSGELPQNITYTVTIMCDAVVNAKQYYMSAVYDMTASPQFDYRAVNSLRRLVIVLI